MYPIEFVTLKDSQRIVELKKIVDEEKIFTDGELLHEEEAEIGKNVVIANPTFVIRKKIFMNYIELKHK